VRAAAHADAGAARATRRETCYTRAVLTRRFLKLSGLDHLLPWFLGVLILQGVLFRLLVVALGDPTD